jgi:hypothetical protein
MRVWRGVEAEGLAGLFRVIIYLTNQPKSLNIFKDAKLRREDPVSVPEVRRADRGKHRSA